MNNVTRLSANRRNLGSVLLSPVSLIQSTRCTFQLIFSLVPLSSVSPLISSTRARSKCRSTLRSVRRS